MHAVALLAYVHILLMVFWIGTDVGVYLAGLRFIDPKLSIPERTAVINLGMVIDRFPRVCFVAMMPVGLQLGRLLGLLPLSFATMAGIWVLAGIWMVVVVAGIKFSGTPRARPWRLLERTFLGAGLLGFTAAGIAGGTGWLGMPGWLAGKLAAFGAMCLFALLLDHSFVPVLDAFTVIVAQGSTPAREAVLRRRMFHTYVWVLAIYAAVLLSGFLGTVQP